MLLPKRESKNLTHCDIHIVVIPSQELEADGVGVPFVEFPMVTSWSVVKASCCEPKPSSTSH